MEWKDDQLAALQTGGNLLVSASAGSGKTTVMIEKIMRIIQEENGDIRRILAVTFGSASALDMKEKLVKELYKGIRGGGKDVEKLKKQAEYVPSASISTIDSFCYGLYKRYFTDLNMSPSYTVLETNEATLMFSEAVDRTLEVYLENRNDKDFYSLAEKFINNRKLDDLKKTIIKIASFLNSVADETEFVENAYHILQAAPDVSPVYNWFLAFYRKKLRKVQVRLEIAENDYKFLWGSDTSYIDIIISLNSYIDNILQKTTLSDFLNASVDEYSCRMIKGSKKDTEAKSVWIKEMQSIKGQVKDLRDELLDYPEMFKNSDKDTRKHTFKLFELCKAAKDEYKKAKEAVLGLDFPDLGRLTVKLLSNPERREEITKCYDYVFVDEYQDTNYLQESIVKAVAGENNLYAVGDPKQSIYGFRFAEPKLFIDRYKRYTDSSEGTKIDLNYNFRSDERILSFINDVCSEVMTYDFGGVDYAKNAKLINGWETYPVASELPAVEVASYASPKRVKKEVERGLYDMLKDAPDEDEDKPEDVYIVDKIKSIVGKEYYFDGKAQTKKLIRYSDIAILLRARRGSESLLSALSKAGIPFISQGFDKTSPYEKGLLIDFLRIIDNMANDIPLANVMQSEIFGFSVTEMLKIRKITPKVAFWEAVIAYNGDQTIYNKIQLLLQKLEYYRKKAAFFTVFDLFCELLTDGFQQILLKKGRETAEKVNCFINSLENASYALTITDFLNYCEKQDESTETPPFSGDTVRIMTLHQSKGLEFPIVFFARAHKGFNSSVKSGPISLDGEWGLALLAYDEEERVKTKSLFSTIFRLKSDFRDREEMLRLMYVGLTRAKNHLFICGQSKEGAGKKLPEDLNDTMSWIFYAAEKNAEISRCFVDISEKLPETKVIESEKQELCSPVDFSPLSREYVFKNETLTPAKYTVTEINRLSEEEDGHIAKHQYYDKSIPDVGILYHRIMQLLDFSRYSLSEIEEQIKDFEAEGIINAEEKQSIDVGLLFRVLGSEVLDEARKTEILREKEFMLYLPYCEVDKSSSISDKVLVQGVIDLLIPGEATILVDYKYSKASPDVLRERYRAQLETYALAVEKILGRTVTTKYICQINENNWIKI